MPCITEYLEEANLRLSKEVTEFEAMLCGVLSVLRDRGTTPNLDIEIISMVDESECGVKRSRIKSWWLDHQEKDKERKLLELKESERLAAVKTGLAKLSKEERKALNLD